MGISLFLIIVDCILMAQLLLAVTSIDLLYSPALISLGVYIGAVDVILFKSVRKTHFLPSFHNITWDLITPLDIPDLCYCDN